jgi:maleamate amidohydrolase
MSSNTESIASPVENYRGVWGSRVGFGLRPVLLVVDFVKAYTIKDSPLYASGVGPAVEKTVELLAVARQRGIPIIHTTASYQTSTFINGGVWIKKAPVVKILAEKPYSEFCDGVEPLQNELVITKQYASAFFGTSLSSTLTAANIDTVIVTGCSTSGCIRATSVDGAQHGFRVIVPRECVGDRHAAPHEANLFDIDSKYGDVVSMDQVIEYLIRTV